MTDSTTTPALDLDAIEARLKAIEPYGFPDQWRAELFEENEPQAPNGWIVFGQDDSVEAAICTVFGGNQDPETISKFIAGARQDIPAMVAEIRSLREEVAKLKAAPLVAEGMELVPKGLIWVTPEEMKAYSDWHQDQLAAPAPLDMTAIYHAANRWEDGYCDMEALGKMFKDIARSRTPPGANPTKGEG